MSEHHFNYFRVKNFKRFKDLEVKNIGQFNLVLGDNNVGKTSLLESLTISKYHKDVNAAVYHYRTMLKLGLIKSFRGVKMWSYFLKSNFNEPQFNDQTNSIGSIEFTNGENDGIYRSFRIDIKNFGLVGINFFGYKQSQPDSMDFSDLLSEETLQNFYIPFIPFFHRNEAQMAQTFSDLRHFASKNRLIEKLKFIVPNIKEIEVFVDENHQTLSVTEITGEFPRPISYYGEGAVKSLQIILILMRFKRFPVMIDEIDAGIHYSRMKDYWKVILQSAQENDVQIFATTHNRECIQYFIEALDELGTEYEEKARAIRLVEHAQTKEIVSFTNSIDEVTEDFAVGNEVR